MPQPAPKAFGQVKATPTGTRLGKGLQGAAAKTASPPNPAWVAAVRLAAQDVLRCLYERYSLMSHQDTTGLKGVLDFCERLRLIENHLYAGEHYSAAHIDRVARGVFRWSEQIRVSYPMSVKQSGLMSLKITCLINAINANHKGAIEEARKRAAEQAPL